MSRFLLVFTLLVVTAAAQQASAPAAPAVDDAFVQKQFGSEFTTVPGIPAAFGDLDGDGIEDVAIVAKGKNPLIDEAENGYKVSDPYHSFYGLGDPKITTKFSENDDPKYRGLSVLIIHGAGPDAWHSDTPKAKFVIINLPFTKMAVKRIKLGKKVQMAIYAQESSEQGESSAVYFDGKKYRYQPMGSSMEN
jgi:hypothetical protein